MACTAPSAGSATCSRPPPSVVQRVAQPFRDAGGWAGDVQNARHERDRLRQENARLRKQLADVADRRPAVGRAAGRARLREVRRLPDARLLRAAQRARDRPLAGPVLAEGGARPGHRRRHPGRRPGRVRRGDEGLHRRGAGRARHGRLARHRRRDADLRPVDGRVRVGGRPAGRRRRAAAERRRRVHAGARLRRQAVHGAARQPRRDERVQGSAARPRSPSSRAAS